MPVEVFINGVKYTAENPEPSFTLNEFIRYQTPYPGTKRSCAEGGCGACAVGLTFTNGDGKTVTRSINSCLRPVAACNGMHVTTIEGIGGANKGYNPIQKALAEHNGSQCGFCSPGMVMAMWGLLQSNPKPSALEIEKNFDGNICRCTGYRPIMAAFKTFAGDAEEVEADRKEKCKIRDDILDVEEAPQKFVRDPSKKADTVGPLIGPTFLAPVIHPQAYTASNGAVWVDAVNIASLRSLLTKYAANRTYLVAGRTAYGVRKYYPHQPTQVYINIRSIPELNVITKSGGGVTVGAALPIVDVIDVLNTAKTPIPQSFAMVVAHLERIAHVLVRNVGSLGGNLMLAHNHQTNPGNSFPSDACTVLFGVGASVNLEDSNGHSYPNVSIESFLATNMAGKFIVSINIPYPAANERFRSYKTALRHVNSHAIVNAACRAIVDPSSHKITQQPTLVFGGVRGAATRMTATETAMVGVNVTDTMAFHRLCATLKNELKPTVERKVEYVESLAISYFYKFFLALQPSLPPNLVSAAQPWLTRTVSHGSQSYQLHPDEAPVGEYMPKLTAIKQTSGEAQYVDDIPAPAFCLHGAFVKSTQANAKIVSIDATQALAMQGVRAFYSHKDIDPARNYWLEDPGDKRRLFAIDTVGFWGQPVGMIVADTQAHADMAAKHVVVHYSDIKTGIYDLDDAITQKSFWPVPMPPTTKGDAAKAIQDAPHKVKGSVSCGAQYHFHMETQTCLAQMDQESIMTLYHATQMPPFVQEQVAKVIGMSDADVVVEVRRCGGGYGGKLTNSVLGGVAAAFATHKLGLPVKMVFDLNTNMEMVGNRHPIRADYEAGFDTNGKLLGITTNAYLNSGQGYSDGLFTASSLVTNLDGCYNCPNWYIDVKFCKTNIAPNTACRGPGWVPSTLIIEHIMNHVGNSLNKPLYSIKEANFYKKGDTSPTGDQLKYWDIDTIWSQLMASSDFTKRITQLNAYNAANKWRKKGISVVPVKFGVDWAGSEFTCLVDVYPDGSVAIGTGGIEIGQGLHTKVAQVVARMLKCPISMCTVMPFNTRVNNLPSEATGGSITSELCGMAAMNTCDMINEQLKPVRAMMPAGYTWKELVAKAFSMGTIMSAKNESHTPSNNACGSKAYNSYSAAVSEVELDVLTGETEITRVDILFDGGYSLNPAVDIGQVEGAFTMGIGYYLSEEHLYNKNGKLFNNGTWEYKPPSALDIPLALNVALLKNHPNTVGFMSSKCQGEPPMCCSVSVMFAVEDALKASLMERGAEAPGSYTSLDGPATVDKITNAAQLKYTEFHLK